MKVKARFTAEFEATLEVADNATPEDIGEALADCEIPETADCKYVEDTFDVPNTDEEGNPVYEIIPGSIASEEGKYS